MRFLGLFRILSLPDSRILQLRCFFIEIRIIYRNSARNHGFFALPLFAVFSSRRFAERSIPQPDFLMIPVDP